jgi:hypothetical protein
VDESVIEVFTLAGLEFEVSVVVVGSGTGVKGTADEVEVR